MNEHLSDEEREKRTKALGTLSKIGEDYRDAMALIVQEQENYWNSLTTNQQIDLFCCVVRRICDGELRQKGSYRYVLYDTFGFDPSAYGLALEAGYMELHNSIRNPDDDFDLLEGFCKEYGIDDSENKIMEFLK